MNNRFLILKEEIMERSPQSFDLEIQAYVPDFQSKKIIKRLDYLCDCGIMQFTQTGGGRFFCAECGEFRSVAIAEDTITDSKDYSTAAHCQIWLNRLQGKDCINLTDDQRVALVARATRKCTIADKFQQNLVPVIRCDEIREWLRQNNLSHFNKNIPTIRRIITRELGREIIPPQFTMDEEKLILEEWNRVSERYQENYREMKRSAKYKTNNPYYPICILFIVEQLFGDDLRVAQMREYIHKQSLETMELRRKCWTKTLSDLEKKK